MSKINITYISHACLLIDIGGVTILTDPWMIGPCWGGNLWLYPPPKISPKEINNIDYIYISHAHEDHLHAETLDSIDSNVKSTAITIVPKFEKSYFIKSLLANGLNNIKSLKNGEEIQIHENLHLTMYINDLGDDDSSLLIETEKENIFLQSDNLMSKNLAKDISQKCKIDLAFIMTTRTGVFPGFYDYDPEVLLRLAKEKSYRSYDMAIDLIKQLKAKHVIPYACDLCYLGDLYYINEFHRRSKRDFVDYYLTKGLDSYPYLMGPGDIIGVGEGEIRYEISHDHDFNGKDLALYAYQNRHKVKRYSAIERMYMENELDNDIDKFIEKFNIASKKWNGDEYIVNWRIESIKLGQINLIHNLPDRMVRNCSKLRKYDLEIVVDACRIQRLVRGDYKMGILTLQNGSICCKRQNETIDDNEIEFWTWASLHTRFNVES